MHDDDDDDDKEGVVSNDIYIYLEAQQVATPYFQGEFQPHKLIVSGFFWSPLLWS